MSFETKTTALSRRALMTGGAALLGLVATSSEALALTARPRLRVILDNDFSGDPDGLFQLAHHLASPSVEIPLVIGSHIHVNDFLDGSTTQADNAVAQVRAIYARMKLVRQPPVIAGRNAAPPAGAKPEATPAAKAIIAEALRDDTRLPLFYCAGAGLTDLAEALRLEPRIAGRMKLVWIGGHEHDDLLPGVPRRKDAEYNATIDLAAVQTVFNDSAIEIWQIPRNVYRQLMISHAELEAGLKPSGRLGTYLLEQLERVVSTPKISLGETYILGDSPLVTLTALQSSFEPDSASSAYVVRPTPRVVARAQYEANPNGRPMRVYTTIDTRLTFADMFAKFAVAGR
ncbi:nucleoside hydrolase [Caulobacter endophyticus]|uniref:nucleoside hydrolase n=1 Tax=Caulobacter endophyticus TaxID=2172652 RepID=UPI0024107D9F|nr:nucleoside hydrolase [Caulobacter endophyticus]MDG2528827.1 nucleoside hydrolase [Caulobacter endophyticus]